MPRRRAALVGDFFFDQHFKRYLNSLLRREVSICINAFQERCSTA